MRVLALTFGDANLASSKYRVHQYIEPLRALGIRVEAVPASSFSAWRDVSTYDAVLVQKKLFDLGKVRRLRKLARRLVYDVDDAIWHPHGKPHSWLTNLRTGMRLKAVVQAADAVVAANEVLAAHLRRFRPQVEVIPMALDDKVWTRRNGRDPKQPLRIGWAGHPVNLPYLQAIEPALVAVQRKFPKAEFCIFCGKADGFKELRYHHVTFDPKVEVEIIHSFDIGLLPLSEGPFAQGKSPVKGLQYMASGAATVLTPLGATRAMFQDTEIGVFARTMSEWENALTRLLQQPALLAEIGKRARRAFEERYTLSCNVERYAALLRGPSTGG